MSCPFREHKPSNPEKYGIKIWAACDATSSYAWNLEVYIRKPDEDALRKKSKNRPVNSSKFVYTADMSLVSYVPKKRKNVVLMSTLHRDGRICGLEHQKPEIIMDYNATKGGVDNMDKLVSAYSFKRRTLRWPLAIFFNILDIPAYNAFITWMALNPEWKRGKLRRI